MSKKWETVEDAVRENWSYEDFADPLDAVEITQGGHPEAEADDWVVSDGVSCAIYRQGEDGMFQEVWSNS